MSFPRYPKYKASGVEWLGEVPEHWEVVPFKHRCSRYALYGANMSSDEYVSNGVRFLRTTDISENGELEPDGVFISPEVAREYLLKDRDILISRSGTIGRAFVFAADVHPECAYAGYLVRFVPTKQLNSRLFFYFTKSVAFSDWLQTQLIFSTIGNVNGQKYAQCRLTLPPLPEQITIAAFLDHETAKIDELVAEQERLIDLLKEKRQAVISHAVTKGLNPDAPMKDSGIEWLGEVPVGWAVLKLKYLCKVQTGDKDTENAVESGQYLFFVRSQTVERINSMAFDCEAVLTAGDGVGVGKVFHYHKGPFDFHQRVYMMHDFQKVSGPFFFHYLRENFFKVALEGGAKSTVDSLRRPMFMNFPVCVPSVSEQSTIVTLIEAESAKFDTLTTEANRVIDLLKERRIALISAAVTGQIDVRNLVPVESA